MSIGDNGSKNIDDGNNKTMEMAMAAT